ncbi:flagellar basal body P-ring formation chaperone FlgA [Hyphomicrobium sp.]|uniref:flagellar basal body P-ring formation chaperone FlgA n=1 Tax=Hyphomicrobium sp. TaxID=82 RepID=UPI002E37AB4F|nr:flagellar basal body P-ring formation chaperone FlgA [Hyphomicrobium sp.]HEX2841778.1 flagellar basal body P-ring formation chaperone FlgA [Hyphomicrobium sp.]
MVQRLKLVTSGTPGILASWARGLLCVCAVVFSLPLRPALALDLVLPVPRATVYPGNVITEDMLVDRAFRDSDNTGAGYVATRESVVGKVARQTLLPNTPIALGGIRDPFTVQQGQPTVVIFQSGGLIISGTATSLQSGSAGQVISLRNVDSGMTIRGVVQSNGTVRVGTP